MKPFFTLLLLLCVCGAHAQTDSLPAPTLEELAAEVRSLKAKTSTWDKVLSRLPRISGFVQAGFEWDSEDNSSFFIKRVRLSLAGELSPKFDYCFQIEFTKPQLLDAFVQYKPFPELNFKLGQYGIPFSIENDDYNPRTMELIEYPLAVSRLVGFKDLSGVSGSGRDRGLSVLGGFIHREGFDVIRYELALLNGEGLGSWDNNNRKEIVGRLSLTPFKGLMLSGSYYDGALGKERIRRTRYAAGGVFERGRVLVRGEWIGGLTGTMDSSGGYVTAGCRMVESLTALVRYDTLTENTSDTATRQTNYTAGLLWQPFKYLRCQLNYTYEDFASPAISNHHVVALMLTGMF